MVLRCVGCCFISGAGRALRSTRSSSSAVVTTTMLLTTGRVDHHPVWGVGATDRAGGGAGVRESGGVDRARGVGSSARQLHGWADYTRGPASQGAPFKRERTAWGAGACAGLWASTAKWVLPALSQVGVQVGWSKTADDAVTAAADGASPPRRPRADATVRCGTAEQARRGGLAAERTLLSSQFNPGGGATTEAVAEAMAT